MLTLKVLLSETFNEKTNEFHQEYYTLQLEYSLISMQKWEQIYHKPYANSNEKKTGKELLDFIKCMTITKNVPEQVYGHLSYQNIIEITKYMNNPMSGYKLPDKKDTGKYKKPESVESWYSAMIDAGIPFECAKWHINSLQALIVCHGERHAPKKKLGRQETIQQYKDIEEHNRKWIESLKQNNKQ